LTLPSFHPETSASGWAISSQLSAVSLTICFSNVLLTADG